MASDFSAEPLPIAINNSIITSTFPNNAKIASVVPVDKKTDKFVISNFRQVSILSCFSKVYENVIKNELLKSMNVHLSPFISAYRKNYNTQHALLRLLEEWREHLDNNKIVGGILMDLSKAFFDCVPHDLLLTKLAAYGIDDYLILYIYSYLLNRKQCVCINNIPTEFNRVISDVPQGSIFGPTFFNCFFNDFLLLY